MSKRIFWGDLFWGDLHRLAGAWSIPFIAIMAVTACWFLILAILFDNHVSISTAGIPPVVARGDVPVVTKGAPAPRITLEQAAEAVQQQLPDLEPSFVQFPTSAYRYIRVGGRGSYGGCLGARSKSHAGPLSACDAVSGGDDGYCLTERAFLW